MRPIVAEADRHCDAGLANTIGKRGGLLIHAFGIHAVYLLAAILIFSGAWVVGRELRVRVPAPVLTP
jgi:hypothetical protein